MQPPLGAGAAAGLEYRLTLLIEITAEAGTVVAGTLDSPHPPAVSVAGDKAHGFPIAATVGRHRLLRNDRT